MRRCAFADGPGVLDMLSAQKTSGGGGGGGYSQGAKNARDEEVQTIHRAFDVIDKDHSGEVDRHEVRPGRLFLPLQVCAKTLTGCLVYSCRSCVWS